MHLQNRVSGHGVAAHTYGHLCTHDISESQIDGKAWKSLFDARGASVLHVALYKFIALALPTLMTIAVPAQFYGALIGIMATHLISL